MIGLTQKTVNNSLQQEHSGLKPQKIGPDILWKRQQNCHFLLNQNRLILAFVLSPKKNQISITERKTYLIILAQEFL